MNKLVVVQLYNAESCQNNEKQWVEEFEKELNRQLNSQEIEFVRWLTLKAKKN
jgi:hypothetical protein